MIFKHSQILFYLISFLLPLLIYTPTYAAPPLQNDQADLLMNEATEKLDANNYEEAIPLFQRVVDQFPQSDRVEDALLGLIYSYYALNRYTEAQEAAETLYELYPDSEAIPILLGLLEGLSAQTDSLCDELGQIGITLYQEERYSEALSQFEEALACYQQINNRDGEGASYNNLGAVYDGLGQYEQALDAYQQALTIRREIGDRSGEAQTLNNLGTIFEKLGQYEQALETYQQSLSIRREVGDQAGEGTTLNNIGAAYASLGQYEQALDFYQQSLAIRRRLGDQYGESVVLNNLADTYENLGQYQQALDYYQQSLALMQALGDTVGEASVLNNLGAVYGRLGQYEQALETFEQVLKIMQAFNYQEGMSVTLNNIGQIYMSMGQTQPALEAFEQSLTIAQAINDRAGQGQTLINIGSLHQDLGQYEPALTYYQQSLSILQEVNDLYGQNTVLGNIGTLYDDLGQPEQALAAYQQSLNIAETIGDQAGQSIILNNIGLIYRKQGQLDQALDNFQQALTIQQNSGARSEQAATLNNIGSVYDSQEQFEQALASYQQSLEILQEVGDRQGEGTTLNNIGNIYDRLGQPEHALDYYQQSLTIREAIGDRAGQGITLNNIGTVYASLGQVEQALDYFEQAMTTLETVRAEAGSEQGRASYIAQYAFLYRNTVDLYVQQGQDAAAFVTTERGRARAFLDSLATGQVRLRDDADADLLAQEQTLYRQRQVLRLSLAQARVANPPSPAQVADLEDQLAAADEAYEVVQQTIAARGAELAALVPGRSAETVLNVEQVRKRLDEQTTLVSYYLLQDKLIAFVLTADRFELVTIAVDPAELAQEITTFREFSSLDESHPASVIKLYETLIAPLKDHLTTPHLAIIPHGILHYLPFAALTDGQRYLVEDYLITTLPSASTLPFIQNKTGRSLDRPLIVGSPATDVEGLSLLLSAKQEARVIAELFNTEPLLDEFGTEQAIWDQGAESGLLHLAAHGEYDPGDPLASTLYLAPSNNSDDPRYDGQLEVSEIYGLNLKQADLVVLSACETQLGDVSAGDEVVGLTRAFFFAGTPSVIASLWQVDDEASAMLMERFYTHLREGMGKAAALRQAQLEVKELFPNPFFWSAFVLSGDGGIINLPESTETLSSGAAPISPEVTPSIPEVAEPSSGGVAPVSPEVSSSASERGSLALLDGRILVPIILAGLFFVGILGVAGWQWQKHQKRKAERDSWQGRLEILHNEYTRLQSTPEGPGRNRALSHINREIQELKQKLGQRD